MARSHVMKILYKSYFFSWWHSSILEIKIHPVLTTLIFAILNLLRSARGLTATMHAWPCPTTSSSCVFTTASTATLRFMAYHFGSTKYDCASRIQSFIVLHIGSHTLPIDYFLLVPSSLLLLSIFTVDFINDRNTKF